MANPVHAGSRFITGPNAPDAWSWMPPRGPEHFRRCSYCGSIHPEDLVAEVGWRAEWADRKYGWPHKFYANIPDRDGKLDWLGGSSSPMSPDDMRRYGNWKNVADLTAEEREACERARIDLDGYAVVGVGVRDTHHAKFYTEHLADPEIADAIKEQVYRRGGLVFTFTDDGKVSWRGYDYSQDAA